MTTFQTVISVLIYLSIGYHLGLTYISFREQTEENKSKVMNWVFLWPVFVAVAFLSIMVFIAQLLILILLEYLYTTFNIPATIIQKLKKTKKQDADM